eukprot:g7677.t1
MGSPITRWAQIGGHDARTPAEVPPSAVRPGSRLGIASWVSQNNGVPGVRMWMFGGSTTEGVWGDLWYYEFRSKEEAEAAGRAGGFMGDDLGYWTPVRPAGGEKWPANRTGASTWTIPTLPCDTLAMFGGRNVNYDLARKRAAAAALRGAAAAGRGEDWRRAVQGDDGGYMNDLWLFSTCASASGSGSRWTLVSPTDEATDNDDTGGAARAGDAGGVRGTNRIRLRGNVSAVIGRGWEGVSAGVGAGAGAGAGSATGAGGEPAPREIIPWPTARAGAVTWENHSSGDVFIFGGSSYTGAADGSDDALDELWRFSLDPAVGTAAPGWQLMPNPTSAAPTPAPIAAGGMRGRPGRPAFPVWPPPRSLCRVFLCADGRTWSDPQHNLWLFGGATGDGRLFNDMWRYDGRAWTCEQCAAASAAGASASRPSIDMPGLYEGSFQWPGARVGAAVWRDANGDLLLYGGFGLGHQEPPPLSSLNRYGYLNDMWRFNGSAWAWNGLGSWSNDNTPPTSTWPGARAGMALWSSPDPLMPFTVMYGGANFAPSSLKGSEMIQLDDMWAISALVPPPTPAAADDDSTGPKPKPAPAPEEDDDSGSFSFSPSASVALISSLCAAAFVAGVGYLVVRRRRRRLHRANAAGIERMISKDFEGLGPGAASPLLRSPRHARGSHSRSHSRSTSNSNDRNKPFAALRRGSGRSGGASHSHSHSHSSSEDGGGARQRGWWWRMVPRWAEGDSGGGGGAYGRLRSTSLGGADRTNAAFDETNEEHLAALLGEYGAADLLIPFADVEILRKLAAGGGGNVYLGEMHGVAVVLKEVFSQVVDESYGAAEFWHEAKMLHMLNHPHVVQFLGVTQNGKGDLMLVTEFCARGNFAEVAARREYNPRTQFVKHALQLAKTMRWLHTKDVIHRDLKPQNVLIDANGNLKLCDLGLARVQADQSQGKASVTGGAGSPAYMAPEVMRAPEGSRSKYDGKAADVYSCSMVLVFMWSQAKLYEGMSSFQIISAVSKDGLRPALPRDMPPRLAQLVRCMWDEVPG